MQYEERAHGPLHGSLNESINKQNRHIIIVIILDARTPVLGQAIGRTALDHLLATNTLLVAEPVSPDGLPLHVVTCSRTCTGTHGTLSLRLHGAPRTIRSIERRTSPGTAVVRAPAGLASPDSIVEAIESAGSSAVDEGSVAQHGNVVEAEVPHRGVDHAVAAEGHEGANDSTSEDVVPVVVLINGEGAADQARAEQRGIDGDELPHGGVVVGEDLELGIEVEVQEDEASEGGGGVTRGHGLERIVDFLPVARADAAVEHDGAVPVSDVGASGASGFVGVGVIGKVGWDDGLADGEEVRAEAWAGLVSVCCGVANRLNIPPINHLTKTWNTAATIREYNRPMVALLTSQNERTLIWQMRKTAKGMKKAIKAAAQMGTISLRRG